MTSMLENAMSYRGGLASLDANLSKPVETALNQYSKIYKHDEAGHEAALRMVTLLSNGLENRIKEQNSENPPLSQRYFEELRDSNVAKIYALNIWLNEHEAKAQVEEIKKPQVHTNGSLLSLIRTSITYSV